MHERRDAVRGRGLEEVEDLVAPRRGRVGEADAESQRARVEPARDELQDLRDLLRRRALVRLGVLENERVLRGLRVRERSGGLQQLGARAGGADPRAEVDERLAGVLAVELGDGLGAALELERGRHAVERGEAVAAGGLPVVVEVDEAGGDDQALGVDRVLAGEALIAAILEPRMPMLRGASRPDSGSITRA